MSIRFSLLPVLSIALLAASLTGCADSEGVVTEVQTADVVAANSEAAVSEHHHTAPHGGHLIPLGDHEYNIELVFSAEPRELQAYILGGHATKIIGLELESFDFDQEDNQGNEVEIPLTADPQEGDAEGLASRYTARGDAIPASIKSLEDLSGHVHIEIDGKEYTGDLEHGHDEKGHHEHEGEEEHGHHADDGDKHDSDGEGHTDAKDGDAGHSDADGTPAPAEEAPVKTSPDENP
ncbi:MAG: hypothetical protein VB858_03420 [Planctomycetaceae bacterium]